MVFLFSRHPVKSKLLTGSEKQKPPCGGGCFLFDRGAGGDRTRVQARRPYAFYMLILP